MLKELCNGIEASKSILIEDSADQCGRSIFLSFIIRVSQRVDRVVLFCWEKPACYYSALIPSDLSNRIVLVDCTDDPLNWLESDSTKVDSSLTSVLAGHLRDSDHRCAVGMDGLTFLLLHHPVPYTCQTLHGLKTCKPKGNCVMEQVISLVHVDVHSCHDISMVEHLATSTIHVTPSPDLQHHLSCNIVHQRVSGKTVKTIELVKLDGLNIFSTQEFQQNSVKTSPDETEIVDPAANLTFNLTLSDKEKEARRHLVLPYMKEQTSSGKIFYEPDDADDFDDEDPDDDLDI